MPTSIKVSQSKHAQYFLTEWLQIKDGDPQVLSIQIAVCVEFRKDSAYPLS